MNITATDGSNDSGYPFRVGPGYISYWIHEFEHWRTSQAQEQAVRHLETTLLRLLEKRDQMQAARGLFGPVSIFYPNAHPSPRQQENFFHATQEFFNSYYGAVSALNSLVKRHWDIFGDAPNGSISKFLKWWQPYGLFMEDAYPILESARAFRAMLSHVESQPTYDWHTATDNGLTKILLMGTRNDKGEIPEGTDPYGEDNWAILAPDEDLVVTALAVQLNAVVPRIEADKPKSRAMHCTWKPIPSPDDVSMDYPVFAHGDGIVADLVTQTIQTDVSVTNAAGETIALDDEQD